MTKVTYKKNGNFIQFIKIKGHSNFSIKGTDIVCSGISSIIEGSYSFFKNNCSELVRIEKNSSKVEIIFTSLEENQKVQSYFEIILHQLKNISHFYPYYLSIKIGI